MPQSCLQAHDDHASSSSESSTLVASSASLGLKSPHRTGIDSMAKWHRQFRHRMLEVATAMPLLGALVQEEELEICIAWCCDMTSQEIPSLSSSCSSRHPAAWHSYQANVST